MSNLDSSEELHATLGGSETVEGKALYIDGALAVDVGQKRPNNDGATTHVLGEVVYEGPTTRYKKDGSITRQKGVVRRKIRRMYTENKTENFEQFGANYDFIFGKKANNG